MSRLPPSLLEHLRTPRNVGEPAGGHDLRGEARHPACRDHLVLYLVVREGRVAAAGFRASGCPAALGMASAATELLAGLPVGEALPAALVECWVATFGEPAPLHRHALRLVQEALGQALASAAHPAGDR